MARPPADRLIAFVTLWLAASPAGAAQDPALNHYDFTRGAHRTLTAKLREISGLARLQRTVYAHNDERGTIWQIDERGAITPASMQVSRQALFADFEGIAATTTRLIMVTRNGVLYADGWQRDTRSGSLCEIEGLAYHASANELLLGCKNPYHRRLRGRTVVLAYSLTGKAATPVIRLELQREALKRHIGSAQLRITSVEVHPHSNTVFILSSQPRAIVECDWHGNILAARKLSAKDHPQPEALTFDSDGRLWIGDEGQRSGRLTIYPIKARVRS